MADEPSTQEREAPEEKPNLTVTQMLEAEDSEQSDSNPEGGAHSSEDDYIRRLKEQLSGREKQASEATERLKQLEARQQQYESENNQLRAYLQQQQAYAQQVPAQAAAMTPQQQSQAEDFLSPDELKKLANANLEEDFTTQQQILNRGFQRAMQSATTQLQQSQAMREQEVSAYNHRQQTLLARISREQDIADPNSPLAQKTREHYTRIVSNPGEMATIPNEIYTPQGGQPVNLYAMELALLRAKAEVGSSRQVAERVKRETAEHHIEASDGPESPYPGGGPKKVTIKDLLLPDELAIVEKFKKDDPGYSVKTYASWLNKTLPGLLETRRETGKPISQRQWKLGLKG